MKRILAVMLAVLVVTVFSFGECMAKTSEPTIDATTGVLIDATSGEILWEKNSHVEMAPASMTKMMTAILAVENLSMDTVVTADKEMAQTGGNVIYMYEGEKFTVEQLLKAMMVGSENDCAVALAKTVSGSVKDFANLMNGRAKELGCKNTFFKNPNGLDESGHESSAYDMALIARELMSHKELREIVALPKYTIPKTNMSPKRKIESTNRLLWDKETEITVDKAKTTPYLEGCLGIKTGYTDNAQGCLAAAIEKDGAEIISVVMHAGDIERFADTKWLLKWASDNFTVYNKYKEGDSVGKVKVKGGKPSKADTYITSYAGGILKEGEDESAITTEVVFDEELYAPLEKGTKVGVVKVQRDGKQISEIDIMLAEDVEEGLFGFIYTGHVAHLGQLILFCIGCLFVLLVLLVIVLRIINKKKNKKRRAAIKKRAMMQKKAEDKRREELQKKADYYRDQR